MQDIEYLNKLYNLYTVGDAKLGIQGYDIKSANTYSALLRKCKNELQITKLEKKRMDGGDVGKEIKYYSDMNKQIEENAKFTEKQRTGRDYGLSTIGEIIRQVEMEEYVFPDDTLPNDEIDAIIKLMSHTIANGGEDKLWATREGKISQLLKKHFGENGV